MNDIRDYLAKIGRKGGKTRVQKQTPEERAESARRAATARWADNDKRIAKGLQDVNEATKALLKKARPKKASAVGSPAPGGGRR